MDATINRTTQTIIDGIDYAVSTGRLPGLVDAAVRSMPADRMAAMVSAASNECDCIAEMPRWLIANAARF